MILFHLILSAALSAGEYRFNKQIVPHELEAYCRGLGVSVVKTDGSLKTNDWTMVYNGNPSPAGCVASYTYQAPQDLRGRALGLKNKLDGGNDLTAAELRQLLSDLAAILGVQ